MELSWTSWSLGRDLGSGLGEVSFKILFLLKCCTTDRLDSKIETPYRTLDLEHAIAVQHGFSVVAPTSTELPNSPDIFDELGSVTVVDRCAEIR